MTLTASYNEQTARKAWSTALGVVQFNAGWCYLSGTNLPIKQIRFLSSPGTGLSGSFESVLSLLSHQHVHLSIAFPWRETLGLMQNADHTFGFTDFLQRTLEKSKGGAEWERLIKAKTWDRKSDHSTTQLF